MKFITNTENLFKKNCIVTVISQICILTCYDTKLYHITNFSNLNITFESYL